MTVLEKIKLAEPQIRQMLAEKRSMSYVSKEIGVARSYLSPIIKGWGLKTDTFHTKRENPLKDQAEEIINLYKSGVSTYKLEKMFDCGSSSLSRLLRKHGVITRYHYTVNENFLDIIDTQEKAYFLGYFVADGCLADGSNNDDSRISITSIDLDTLENFKILLNFTGPITKEVTKTSIIYRLRFASKHFGDNLIKYGCMPRKTFFTTLPTVEFLPEHLIRHFIRGLLDGDGCIVQRKPPRNVLQASIVGTEPLLISIKDFLHEKLNVGGSLCAKGTIFNLMYDGVNQPLRVLDYLYDDSIIHLDRKYQRYITFKNNIDEPTLSKISNRRSK